MTPHEVAYAARQAWIGFFQTCLREAGGTPVLTFDEEAVAGLLNGHAVAPAAPRLPRRRKQSVPALKRDILERLEEYQIYIRRLKKWDIEAYKLFRRTGMQVGNDSMEAMPFSLEPGIVASLPSFGAIATSHDPARDNDGTTIPLRFTYFLKIDRPGAHVERLNSGTYYRCTCYWDNANDPKLADHGGSDSYMVNVQPDGHVLALRVLKQEQQVIRHKHGADRGYTSRISHQKWGIPDVSAPKFDLSKKPADFIRFVFCTSMNFWAAGATHSMIRITATKQGIVMPFTVDATRTPAFFRDRERVEVASGRRAPIFHIVRPHFRAGRAIKLHFAGARDFVWNGYQVRISVPGKDHIDLADCPIGAVEDIPEEEANSEEYLTLPEFGERMATLIDAPAPEAPDQAEAGMTWAP